MQVHEDAALYSETTASEKALVYRVLPVCEGQQDAQGAWCCLGNEGSEV